MTETLTIVVDNWTLPHLVKYANGRPGIKSLSIQTRVDGDVDMTVEFTGETQQDVIREIIAFGYYHGSQKFA